MSSFESEIKLDTDSTRQPTRLDRLAGFRTAFNLADNSERIERIARRFTVGEQKNGDFDKRFHHRFGLLADSFGQQLFG